MTQIEWYTWVILPFIVFFARIVDVSLGTLRIIFTSRGKRNVAPFLGFIEVFIWIVVVGQIVKNVHSIAAYFGYAAGFAAGTYIGMKIEEKLAIGTLIIRIILSEGDEVLAATLRSSGFGVTVVNGEGGAGPVKLLYTIIKRKDLQYVSRIIHEIHPKAFSSVEEVRMAESGIFPLHPPRWDKK
jgi:uncharacterized protein YebE (UPF0316 family)